MIRNWFPRLLCIVLVIAIFHGPASRAQDAGQTPLAHFKCEKGPCVTTEEGVDRIEQAIAFLIQKIRELQGKSGCI